MADRERVVHRGVVAANRVEIRTEQEGRLAVGARNAGAGPGGIGSAATEGSAGRADLITPMFSPTIFASSDQKARAGTERVIGFAERRHAAVAIVIHPDIE